MTFSSGLPILYATGFVSLVLSYWFDKFLLLRYYRLTPEYTKHMSRAIVNILPLALLLHMIVGLAMFSWPDGLKSSVVYPWFGIRGPYFSNERLGQYHIFIFTLASLLIIAIFVF